MGECLIIRSGGGTDTSGATATASVVLAGYTCYVNDNKITGSMPAQTLNRTLNAGGSVTIPAGYYNGSSVISTSTLAGETAANAASSHILSGYNAWVNGSNTWGNMPNRGNIYHSLPANGSYTIPAGWHAGGGVVNQSLAFHWGGTYTPNTANQVICWANWYAAGNIVVLGSSNLVSWNIKNGVWIFGVLGNFTGWVDSKIPMTSIPGWNLFYPLDTSWCWRGKNSKSSTTVYHIRNDGNTEAFNIIKWLYANGYRPGFTITTSQTKWDDCYIESYATAFSWKASSGFGVAAIETKNYAYDYFNYSAIDKDVQYAAIFPVVNGELTTTRKEVWYSGIKIVINHPSGTSGRMRVTSAEAYWVKT